MEVGDIMRQEIWFHFKKLLKYIVKGFVFMICFTLYLASFLVVPQRFAGNIMHLQKLLASIRAKPKDVKNLKEMVYKVRNNIENTCLDIILVFAALCYVTSTILCFWRIIGHYRWVKQNFPTFFYKLNVDEYPQTDITKALFEQTYKNLEDTIIDIFVAVMFILNALPFWRYPLLYFRYKQKTLCRKDLLVNPFYLLLDLPFVIGFIFTLTLTPWRLLTTYIYLSPHHEHFVNNDMKPIEHRMIWCSFKQGLIDYVYAIPYLIAMLNPFNIGTVISLFKEELDYKDYSEFKQQESYRRRVFVILGQKSVKDLWNYMILLPLSIITLYYLPLLTDLYSNRQIYPQHQAMDKDRLKKKFHQKDYEALVFYQKAGLFIYDSKYPIDFRFAIKLINDQLLRTLKYLPLIPLTLCFNPYRTWQFFLGTKEHEFIHFTYQTKQQLLNMENTKRRNIVVMFQESLTDFIALVASLLITLTGFRALYLIAILSVNGHISFLNNFLRRTTKSTLLIIKLQQIEKLKQDNNEQNRRRLENFLPIKYCIWLSLAEWVLDLIVLPFIIGYFVLIPWRLPELFNMAVSQFERVPTQKIKKNHYRREIDKGEMPKRLQAALKLIQFIAQDYIAIILSAFLIITGWRALNTYELLTSYFKARYTKNEHERAFLETVIKDKSLFQQVLREFKLLILDFFFFLIAVTVVLMVFEAKTLINRLYYGVFIKKKHRQELQYLNYLQKIKQFKKNDNEVAKKQNELQQHQVKKKSITDLNKNIMSVLMPYLHHNEILRVEQTCKKMLVVGNFWPIWKNIYSDQHLKDPKIPGDVKDMQQLEAHQNDYRKACQRCYLFLKRNFEEEVPPELLDYTKGSQLIIVEEFVISLEKLPTAFLILSEKIANVAEKVEFKMEDFYMQNLTHRIVMERRSILQYLALGIDFQHTMDQFDQDLGDKMDYPPTRLIACIVKIYIMVSNIVKFIFIYLFRCLCSLVSAGQYHDYYRPPMGVVREYSMIKAVPLYFIQFIIAIPALLYIFHPVLVLLTLLYWRFVNGTEFLYTRTVFLLLTVIMVIDYQYTYLDTIDRKRPLYPFIRPLHFLTLLKQFITYLIMKVLQGIKWIGKKVKQAAVYIYEVITGQAKRAGNYSWDKIKKLAKWMWECVKYLGNQLKKFALWIIEPLKRAGRGALYYLKIAYDITSRSLRVILEWISKLANNIAHFLYIIIKTILSSTWKVLLWLFEYLIKLPLKASNNVYFSTFEFLLRYLKDFGIVGEFLFTIFGLVWLLWPLAIGYYMGLPEYYIPAVLLTIFMIIKGRKIIVANELHDEKKWAKKVLKIYRAQIYMERNKYLEPFFSQSLDSLVDAIKRTYANLTIKGTNSNYETTNKSVSSHQEDDLSHYQNTSLQRIKEEQTTKQVGPKKYRLSSKQSVNTTLLQDSKPYQSSTLTAQSSQPKRHSMINNDYYTTTQSAFKRTHQSETSQATFLTQTPSREEASVSMLSNYPIREFNIKYLRSINTASLKQRRFTEQHTIPQQKKQSLVNSSVQVNNYQNALRQTVNALRSQTPNLTFKKPAKSELYRRNQLHVHFKSDNQTPSFSQQNRPMVRTPKALSKVEVKVTNAESQESRTSLSQPSSEIKRFQKVSFVNKSLQDVAINGKENQKVIIKQSQSPYIEDPKVVIHPPVSRQHDLIPKESSLEPLFKDQVLNLGQIHKNSKNQISANRTSMPSGTTSNLKANRDDLISLQTIVAQYQGVNISGGRGQSLSRLSK